MAKFNIGSETQVIAWSMSSILLESQASSNFSCKITFVSSNFSCKTTIFSRFLGIIRYIESCLCESLKWHHCPQTFISLIKRKSLNCKVSHSRSPGTGRWNASALRAITAPLLLSVFRQVRAHLWYWSPAVSRQQKVSEQDLRHFRASGRCSNQLSYLLLLLGSSDRLQGDVFQTTLQESKTNCSG